jgi:hypothetical protein
MGWEGISGAGRHGAMDLRVIRIKLADWQNGDGRRPLS